TFLNFLDRCTVALFVLYCIVMYILCMHTESHFTKSNSLFVQTWPIKPDSDTGCKGNSGLCYRTDTGWGKRPRSRGLLRDHSIIFALSTHTQAQELCTIHTST